MSTFVRFLWRLAPLALVVASSALGLGPVVLLLVVAHYGYNLPIRFPVLVRLALGILAWSVALIVLSPPLQWLGLPHGPLLITVLGGVIEAAWATRHAGRGSSSRSAPRARSGALVALGLPIVLGVVVFVVLLTPLHHDFGVKSSWYATSEDPASHISILRGIAREGGVLFWDQSFWGQRMHIGHTTYPPGFHLSAWAGGSLVLGHSPVSPEDLVDTLSGSIAVAMGLAVAASGLAAAATARRFGATDTVVAGAGAVTALLVALGPLFDMVPSGFYPQAFAFALLPALVAVLGMPSFETTSSETASSETDEQTAGGRLDRSRLVVGLLMFVAISYSFYFVTPIAAVVLAGFVLRARQSSDDRRFILVAAVIAGALAAVPVLVGAGGGAFGAINAGGGIVPLGHVKVVAITIFALALLTGLTWRTGWRRAWRVVCEPLPIAILGATAMAIALYGYQHVTAGDTAYYFEKSIYAIYLLSMPLAVALLGVSVAKLGLRNAGALAAMVLVSLVVVLRPLGETPEIIRWTRGELRTADAATFTLVANRYPGPTDRGRFIVWKNSDSPLRDLFASRWLEALYGRWRIDRIQGVLADATLIGPDNARLAQAISRQPPSSLVVVTIDPALRDNLLAMLPASDRGHVSVIVRPQTTTAREH